MTSEWTIWLVSGSLRFGILDQVFSAESTANYDFATSTTYALATPDPVINAKLPDIFDVALTSFAGTETEISPRPTATAFYSTSTFTGGMAVIGGEHVNGRTLHFASCIGSASLSDPNFQRLFSNCVDWLNGGKPTCAADFNNDSTVNSQDFFDFLAAFFETDPSADFNNDTTVNSQDFFDFLAAFFAGC
jgi:hypothetical protein